MTYYYKTRITAQMKNYPKRNMGIIMIGTIAALWLIGIAVFRLWIPDYSFGAYHLVPATFLVFAIVLAWLTARWERMMAGGKISHSRILTNFMIFKGVKVVVSVVVIYLYKRLSGVMFNSFLLTFMFFYAVFLVLETISVSGLTRRYFDGNREAANTADTQDDAEESR